MPFEFNQWLELEQKLNRFPHELGEELSRNAVQETRYYLEKRIDWNRGNLISHIKSFQTGEYQYEVHATGKPAFYEKFVHDGRGSFSAKNKKALHWVDKQGNDVFVPKPKKVKAFGGYHHYLRVESLIHSNLNTHIATALKRVGIQ
ncbi:MAG: hypothetical protein K6A34_01205 [Methanobrevibacter sp.]|nr:hypothetical protein [Methanobrevibacter sp.]